MFHNLAIGCMSPAKMAFGDGDSGRTGDDGDTGKSGGTDDFTSSLGFCLSGFVDGEDWKGIDGGA